ncbi:MAG: MaoC family dehydratase [Chloroflexi bacterium]|nr:MaoC family dehydratase [Chloroflexota bacterium]
MSRGAVLFDDLVVGTEYPETIHHVSPERVRRYIEVIGDLNPLYLDDAFAREKGLERAPAPPTIAGAFIPIWASVWWGVSPEGTVPIRWEYTFHEPIYPGDTFTTRAKVVDKYIRKDRKIAVFRVVAWNQQGRRTVTGTLTAIWSC